MAVVLRRKHTFCNKFRGPWSRIFGGSARSVGGVTEVRGGAICADTWTPVVRVTSVVSIPEVWSGGFTGGGGGFAPMICGGVEDERFGDGTGGGDGVR